MSKQTNNTNSENIEIEIIEPSNNYNQVDVNLDNNLDKNATTMILTENDSNKKRITRVDVFQALKFIGFSISAGVIQILSFTLLNELMGLSYWPSYLISLTLSVLWNFTLNRKFTFKGVNNVVVAMIEVGLYYLVFTPLSTIGGNALVNIGWNEYLILFITMVLNMSTEFLFCRCVVYNEKLHPSKGK